MDDKKANTKPLNDPEQAPNPPDDVHYAPESGEPTLEGKEMQQEQEKK